MTLQTPSPPGDDDLQLVDRVIGGTFRLSACIGSGSSGAVYRADQIALGRTVAVKILRPDLALDPRFVSRFHGEALAASRLNHPNTVAIIDYGQTEDGLLYLAMEHLRGLTLTDVLRTEPLDPARIVDYMAQIAAGVEEAHDAGVVHADLKPDNVVVEHRRGGWDLVKVVDFGIARLLGAPRDSDEENVICGTPEYMAPEVIRGEEPVLASDIYALGAILYELLAGQPPFLGESSVEVLTAQLREIPRPLSELLDTADIPSSLEAIARRALEKDAGDRFPSATAFREALLSTTGRNRAAARTVLCSGCGAMNAATFKFCPDCGHALDAPEVHEAPPPLTDSAPHPAETTSGLFPLRLCGRERTLQRARAFARQSGGVMHIAGPPGSGKTRLLREVFADAAHGEPDIGIYVISPDPSGLSTPYYPVRALLAAVLDLPELCTYEDLAGAALSVGLTERDVPGLGELLAQRGELAELELPARQREMITSARRVLAAAGAHRPLRLVFEDADRYDAPSQRLLADLAARAGESSLRLAVTTAADAETAGASIMASSPGERIELGPLDAGAVGELAADAEHRGGVPLPSAEELAELSGGDPAYLGELVRYASEGGSPAEAPAAIADLISLRLELLPRRALLVAQAIAAYGLEASEADVSAALGDRVGGRERGKAIATLEARGLITASGALRFERALYRDIVYDRIPAEPRRELHAACLERASREGANHAVRGHHLEGAGRAGEAAEELAKAGDAAGRELDEAGAIRYYQRGLGSARRAMLADMGDPPRHLFIEISIKLGDALARTRQLALARGILDEALGHCHGAPTLKAQLLRAIGHVHAAGGEPGAAAASLRQAVGLGIMSGERELLALLYLDLAAYQVEAGQGSQAVFELTEAIDLITAGEGGRSTKAPPSLWRLALRLGKLHAERGDHARALEVGRDAERLATRAASRLGTARARAMIAAQYEALGDPDRATRFRTRAAEGMRALGDRRGTVELLLSGARLTRRLRRIDPDTLAEARTLSEEIGWEEGTERAREAGS